VFPLLASADVCGEFETRTGEVYGRFMGGSDRNTSNSGRVGQSVQVMHLAQRRINTGHCASR
jgi:hypothetical protein